MLPTEKDFRELYAGLLILQDKIDSLGYSPPECWYENCSNLKVIADKTVEFAKKTFLNDDGSVKPYWE